MSHSRLLFMSVFLLLFASCQSNESIQKGKKFYDYDEIDYYFDNYDESTIDELYENQSRSAFDSIKMGVILGDIPQDINDQMFITKLKKIGYTLKIVDPIKFPEIDKIFREKNSKENVVTSCIYIYRDILVFKKNQKVVGIAKICFGCLANQIVGTDAKTVNFGQDGDYYKLEEILNRNTKR